MPNRFISNCITYKLSVGLLQRHQTRLRIGTVDIDQRNHTQRIVSTGETAFKQSRDVEEVAMYTFRVLADRRWRYVMGALPAASVSSTCTRDVLAFGGISRARPEDHSVDLADTREDEVKTPNRRSTLGVNLKSLDDSMYSPKSI